MLIKTRLFELIDGQYQNLSHLAYAMGISVSQIYRVRAGKRHINQKFITGAIKVFPQYKFEDLFYLAPEPSSRVAPRETITNRHRHMAQQFTRPTAVSTAPSDSGGTS